MSKLDTGVVETEMTKLLEEAKTKMGLDGALTLNTCPNNIGITSHILVTITSRLENVLKVAIPENRHLFYDKKNRKHLNIKEAAQKLIRIVQNGK